MAGTLGLASGSTNSSFGMWGISGGKRDITTSLGFGSMNWSKGRFDYLGKKENSTLENVGYFFGGMTNLGDGIRLLDNEFGIEDRWYKKWSEEGKKLNSENELLDRRTIGNNIFSTTNGGDNAKVIGQEEKIYFKPFRGHSLLDIPGGIHDAYWLSFNMDAGLLPLTTKTRTLGGDWRFVGQHLFLATKYLTTKPIEALAGYGIGAGFGILITAKTPFFWLNYL